MYAPCFLLYTAFKVFSIDFSYNYFLSNYDRKAYINPIHDISMKCYMCMKKNWR